MGYNGREVGPFAMRRPVPLARYALMIVVLLVALLSTIPTKEVQSIHGKSIVPTTVMFLHVWKCGGTSLRKLLCDWADREHLPCATVASCNSLSLRMRKICLARHGLIYPKIQAEFIAKQRVIAGHFRWGFQAYVTRPLLITTLRNPLELFVSGEQYLHRKETAALPAATQFVTEVMRKKSLRRRNLPGFLHRLVGHTVDTEDEVRESTVQAAYNLNSFWLVGVVEQYHGFITVLEHLLDTKHRHPDLWSDHLGKKMNASPVRSTSVLASIDPQLVHDFNTTLTYQWVLYEHAVHLFVDKCQEMLPAWEHANLCHVPTAPSEYL